LSLYGWKDCPARTRRQVRILLGELRRILKGNLVGVYLHGSLAMGCFQPAASDIDLLAVVRRPLPRRTKRSLVQLLLFLSGSPHPIEIHFLRPENINPWRHPAPFELHFSEAWRKRFRRDLAAGSWKHLGPKRRTDPDLAAHITVTSARGIRLAGKPIASVFPAVPRGDYLTSIVADLRWAERRLAENPAYAVLNACRVWAYVQNGRICSKTEGASWALRALPEKHHPVIKAALGNCRGRAAGRHDLPAAEARRLVNFALSAAMDES
jgi:predicted nucleotidyltransferase